MEHISISLKEIINKIKGKEVKQYKYFTSYVFGETMGRTLGFGNSRMY